MRYFISAGDPSGDIHAARLMNELKKLDPEAAFAGIGGSNMKLQGLDSLAELTDISVVGFWEVAKKFKFFQKLLAKSKDYMLSQKFDVFIPVDYPGFNIRLATYAKKNGVPVYYYIAPQLWAWGKERAKKLKNAVDKLLVVFPFEEEYFSSFDLNTQFVGHPLLDSPYFSSRTSIDKRDNLIGFFPGSRKQEIDKHSQLINEVAGILSSELENYKMGIARSNYITADYLKSKLDKRITFEIYDSSYELMQKSAVGLVKTGTSTLEAALSGMPNAMFYITSFFTYQLGKNMINLDYIALPNILLNKEVVKEFIQNDAKANQIAKNILSLLNHKTIRNRQLKEFEAIRELLGEKGASYEAAKIIYNENAF